MAKENQNQEPIDPQVETPVVDITLDPMQQALAALAASQGSVVNVESLLPDGSFPWFKLVCSAFKLGTKQNGTPYATMSVIGINGQPVPPRVYHVSNIGEKFSDGLIPAEAVLNQQGLERYHLEARFGRVTKPRDGEDPIHVIELRLMRDQNGIPINKPLRESARAVEARMTQQGKLKGDRYAKAYSDGRIPQRGAQVEQVVDYNSFNM